MRAVAPLLALVAASVALAVPAEARVAESDVPGGHRSAFACAGSTPRAGATRYVLDRSRDGRIVEKNAEGVYVERRDGTGWWRTLARDEVRVVIWSQAPLRAVHGLGVRMSTVGYGRVVDLPRSAAGLYVVKTDWRVRPDVLSTECAP